jgi:hypothetical protein
MYKPGGANVGPRSVLMDLETFCGYKDAERNTLVPGNLVMVDGGTLSSSAAPTLRAMALGAGLD